MKTGIRSRIDIDALAAAVHHSFLDAAERSRVAADVAKQSHLAWTIHPAIQKSYAELSPDTKASNRAAARRIPEHLTLINYAVVARDASDDGSWKPRLAAAIEKHIERLAQAEHLGWCAERLANGWTYAEERDDARKHHPLLVDWSKLRRTDQEKDRSSVRSIPDLLEVAGYKAEPVSNPT